MDNSARLEVHVAGDICLDVVGLAEPPPAAPAIPANNWQLTGETRTHYLLGGAMLLADWVRAALPEASVQSTQPLLPTALACGEETRNPLTKEEFLFIAERLKRDEIVHSLLGLDYFRVTPDAKKCERLRMAHTYGFSGPKTGEPSLKLQPPPCSDQPPDIIVLDDTGNLFRRTPSQWPSALTTPLGHDSTLVVYKLHRPLPGKPKPAVSNAEVTEETRESDLWQTVARHYANQRIVIISIEDLRDHDAPISSGLSWERTALDLVWQLLNVEDFAPLRDCGHLIVRMGLDGAVYFQRILNAADNEPTYRAWLVYDPAGIEGIGASARDGKMVGYGSAFTAALVQTLALAEPAERAALGTTAPNIPGCLEIGIKAGLLASRRLLELGFGDKGATQPNYPSAELFAVTVGADFACQPIPIIPQASVPDRGYWRLLDSIFQNKAALLHRAVALKATGSKSVSAEDTLAERLLRQVPTAVFGKALRTHDRREVENYRALYSLLHGYVCLPTPSRPLSVAVFGPPGAGKSFGVKMVAESLGQLNLARPIKDLTFNLSQYQTPEQLADAFHLVRDLVLSGKLPLVFFDEFDTTLAGTELGWLRYFLAPMQDGIFLDRGAPHPIGPAIFVFAGGTCGTFTEFAQPFIDDKADKEQRKKFKAAKGPDFLSRLRGTLDIPGLDLNAPFDPYGSVDAFPCEAAILLRRAGILSHQLKEKAPHLLDSSQALQVSPVVLRAMLHMPQFEHGNRSFEALLDMSRLPGNRKFTPSLLPASGHVGLHANPQHLSQLLATDYPFSREARELIAQSIHAAYLTQSKEDGTYAPTMDQYKEWDALIEKYQESNREQADHIPVKLRAVGLWYRKRVKGTSAEANVKQWLDPYLEQLAEFEHDRWVAEKRRQGWIAAAGTDKAYRNDQLRWHNCMFRWSELSEEIKNYDRRPVLEIPKHLAAGGYEIVKL